MLRSGWDAAPISNQHGAKNVRDKIAETHLMQGENPQKADRSEEEDWHRNHEPTNGQVGPHRWQLAAWMPELDPKILAIPDLTATLDRSSNIPQPPYPKRPDRGQEMQPGHKAKLVVMLSSESVKHLARDSVSVDQTVGRRFL